MLIENTPFPNLIFLKLGGSLITDKGQPNTPRLEVINRLASELSDWIKSSHKTHLILGHGSGSFGHVPANEYGTRSGVDDEQGWTGFLKVWQAASNLNHIVIECLRSAGLPALALPPSAVVTASNKQVDRWDLGPLKAALKAGLLPVVYGDVAFDQTLGGTILSTEDLFSYLAHKLAPKRILLAGIEPGVWEDYPQRSRIVNEISPSNYVRYFDVLKGSQAVDVTGGMASKVSQNLELIKQVPGLEVVIFSGSQPGTLAQVLQGTASGTTIKL
jgi:isopentenyl phosphate kinase